MSTQHAGAAGRTRPGIVTRGLRRIADLLLPPQCFGCGARVERAGALCGGCWGRIQFIEKPLCPVLGIPFPYDAGDGLLSAEAIANPPPYGRARAVARFDDMARQLVHALKYGDRMECAPLMGAWMARAGAELLADAELIVPVPLYRSRLWRRQYNQSALLAREIGRRGEVPVELDLLRRIRATRAQTGLSAGERARNVAGAFRIRPGHEGAVRGRHVLLVDDVFTTGATAGACCRALMKGGAGAVDVLVFARVVDPVRLPI